MNILICTEIYDSGGIDTFLINLVNFWPDKTDRFYILHNPEYVGIDVIKSRLGNRVSYISYNFVSYDQLLRDYKFLALFKQIFSPVFKYLWLVLLIIQFIKFFSTRKFDFLHVVNGGYPGGDICRAATLAWSLFPSSPKPLHNFHNMAQSYHWPMAIQEKILDRLIYRTSHLVTVSRAASESMLNRLANNRISKIEYIYNGIDISHISQIDPEIVKKSLNIDSKSPMCLMLGTYEHRKGHNFLLKSFQLVLKNVPNATLVICGYGSDDEINTVKALVDKFNLRDSVRLFNFRADAMNILSAANLLLVSSQKDESFGYTSVEAMAMSIPVVATNVGGVPEVVRDGFGGFCVDHSDFTGFADKVVMLITDSSLSRQQGILGRERVRELFTAERMSVQYYELYSNILIQAGKSR